MRIPHICPGVQAEALRTQKYRSAKLVEKLLLDLDSRDAVELLGDGSRVFLRDVLLQGLGSAVDQVLGFLQAKSGDFAYSLDGVDLVRACILEDDGELGLLFCRCRCCCTAARGAAATAAAAETPRRSSSFFTNSEASSRLRLTI